MVLVQIFGLGGIITNSLTNSLHGGQCDMRITKTISLHRGMEKQWGDRGREEKMGKCPESNAICQLPPSHPHPPPTSSPHRPGCDDRRIYKTNPAVVSQHKMEKRKYTDWPRATQLQHRLIGNTHVLFLGGRDRVLSE